MLLKVGQLVRTQGVSVHSGGSEDGALGHATIRGYREGREGAGWKAFATLGVRKALLEREKDGLPITHVDGGDSVCCADSVGGHR